MSWDEGTWNAPVAAGELDEGELDDDPQAAAPATTATAARTERIGRMGRMVASGQLDDRAWAASRATETARSTSLSLVCVLMIECSVAAGDK